MGGETPSILGRGHEVGPRHFPDSTRQADGGAVDRAMGRTRQGVVRERHDTARFQDSVCLRKEPVASIEMFRSFDAHDMREGAIVERQRHGRSMMEDDLTIESPGADASSAFFN